MAPAISPRVAILGGAVYIGASAATYLYVRTNKDPSPCCSCPNTCDSKEIFNKNAEIYDEQINLDEMLMGIKLLRRFLIRKAQGDVLEVAAGTGRNLSYYPSSQARSLTMTDSSREMLVRAHEKYSATASASNSSSSTTTLPVTFALADVQRLCGEEAVKDSGKVEGGGDETKFGPALRSERTFSPGSSFDTVVDTFGLCSCSDPVAALKEMALALRPGGKLLLLEHGRASWDFINRILDSNADKHFVKWGCQWNRDILKLVESAGLEVETNTTNASTSAAGEKYSLIVVFKELKSLLQLKAMCLSTPIAYRFASRHLGLSTDCHMPQICRRVYSTALYGFSGEVTDTEFQTLQRCLPQAVWYRELDGTVTKAEDTSLAGRTPPGLLAARAAQQAAQEAVAASESLRGRKLAQGEPAPGTVVDIPKIRSFETVNKTKGGEGKPIEINDITGGASLGATGQKQQKLDTQLWNLDRIDQTELPLDGGYTYGDSSFSGTGSGVTVYVIDSGINVNHQEFKKADGSGSRASSGYDFIDDVETGGDCDGHGTHVSGTVAGLQVGVAKNANIVSVRILDCSGSGTISDTVAALDWVAANAKKPAVATLSLGIQVGSWSRVLEDAVRALVTNHGITVVVASGNSGVDACYVAPANVPEVISVAATDVDTKYTGTKKGDKESMYRWSNTGPCVDIFAPGVDIYSACGGQSRCDVVDDTSYTFASGTSMAVPAVAGVAALYLEAHPGASPQEVTSAIISAAPQGLVDSSGFKSGTVNRLLTSKFGGGVMAANGP